MKTGYCHIYNHKMPLDSVTDRLHIGNLKIEATGIDYEKYSVYIVFVFVVFGL